MTVSSLWKALDKGESGTRVGLSDIIAGCCPTDGAEASSSKKPPVLAIDLSIWICEALTSFGMGEQHSNPALYLVFTRVMKLRLSGIKLVAVVEGKQRSLDANHRKRRSGTTFWKACNDCQALLELLGVPVVRAKCEGEALCALLNQRGIVDGVISNDGDCLLFGANVVYTKLTNENLDQCQVMCYRSENLRSLVDASDDQDLIANESGSIKLTRQDLITFAILTGSDVAGDGLPKVGHKKAIRFIRKCHIDRPLTPDSAAIEELESWARSKAKGAIGYHDHKVDGKCCTRCAHGGTKRDHLKHGCELCGTEPGEPCLLMTADDRFRKSLREKALTMEQPFCPMKVVEIYMQPNDNALPSQIAKNTLKFGLPSLQDLSTTQLIVKGRSYEGSRSFVLQSVSRFLSHVELHESDDCPAGRVAQNRTSTLRNKPVPQKITRSLVRNQIESFEVQWVVHATVTNEQGDGIDGYEFMTIETQEIVKEKYPDLVTNFKQIETERTKQGNAMQVQRQDFLDRFLFKNIPPIYNGGFKRKAAAKKREAFFKNGKKPEPSRKKSKLAPISMDVVNLLRFAGKTQVKTTPAKEERKVVLPTIPEENSPLLDYPINNFHGTPLANLEEEENQVFCQLGGIDVEITPVSSNRGMFPPRHIFVREKLQP